MFLVASASLVKDNVLKISLEEEINWNVYSYVCVYERHIAEIVL
jgi:hypothetical protein